MEAKERGRYLISTTPRPEIVVHDTQHLTERCNTDAIAMKEREYSDDLGALLGAARARECSYCMGPRE